MFWTLTVVIWSLNSPSPAGLQTTISSGAGPNFHCLAKSRICLAAGVVSSVLRPLDVQERHVPVDELDERRVLLDRLLLLAGRRVSALVDEQQQRDGVLAAVGDGLGQRLLHHAAAAAAGCP